MRVRAAREAAGMTQAQLAAQIGYQHAIVHVIEAGRGSLRTSSAALERLSAVLGLDLLD